MVVNVLAVSLITVHNSRVSRPPTNSSTSTLHPPVLTSLELFMICMCGAYHFFFFFWLGEEEGNASCTL